MNRNTTNVRTGVALCAALLLWVAATKLAGPAAGGRGDAVILQRSKDFQVADTGVHMRVEVTDTYVMGTSANLEGGRNNMGRSWQTSKLLTDTVFKKATEPLVKPTSEDAATEWWQWSGVDLGQGKAKAKNSAAHQVETAEDAHKVLLELIASHHLWE